jgi:hypothetical protein
MLSRFGNDSEISVMTSLSFLPLLRIRVGFVVTPSIKPALYAGAICVISAVSRKIFIGQKELISNYKTSF